jgi:hypothetical protein
MTSPGNQDAYSEIEKLTQGLLILGVKRQKGKNERSR